MIDELEIRTNEFENAKRKTVIVKARQSYKLLAERAIRNGDENLANSYYQRSVTVTYEMVNQLIISLRKQNIDFIVSPYESDAQLAYLSINGYIDVVVTEDSDLLVYGCKHILFKLDKDGNGQEIKRRHLGANKDLSFANWTDDQFKLFCCLAGCDYMLKLYGIGIKTAYKIVSQYKTFEKVISAIDDLGMIDEIPDFEVNVSLIYFILLSYC